jgi:uncharacterized protein (AIM24 family)
VVNAIKSGSADGTTLVFTTGMDNWTPLRQVDRFRSHLPASAPPPIPAASGRPSGPRAHEIDYEIVGEDLQFVVVELDPNESVVAEAGALMYMTQGIQMETIFGDGSGTQAKGLMGALLGAGKRILTGESLFMTVFTAQGGRKEKVAFAAPFPGRILAMDLKQLGGELDLPEGLVPVRGEGHLDRHRVPEEDRRGPLRRRRLHHAAPAGRRLGLRARRRNADRAAARRRRDAAGRHGCLVALQPSVNYDVQFVSGVKTALFGGEGLFFATLTGPGHVWLQSLPLSRLADRIAKAIPGVGRGRKGEGSVLDVVGGLGNMIDGD